MASLLLHKGITERHLKDLRQGSMEHLQALMAATSKHPQARLRRPVLATFLDRQHP